jgi:hypothetical protein
VLQRVVAVQDHVDRHALAAQPGPDRAGQDLEVLNHQHSHERLLTLLDGPGLHQPGGVPPPTMPPRRWRHGVNAVSDPDTLLTPALAYNHLRHGHPPAKEDIV